MKLISCVKNDKEIQIYHPMYNSITTVLVLTKYNFARLWPYHTLKKNQYFSGLAWYI